MIDAAAMEYIIQLIELVSGESDPAQGQYVKEYDPRAYAGRGYLLTTPDESCARRFPDVEAAARYWRQSAEVRPDGRPNRPLTAWTVDIRSTDASVKPA
jgi:hypothetical protein